MEHTGEAGPGEGEKKDPKQNRGNSKMEELSESGWCSSTIPPSIAILPHSPPNSVRTLYTAEDNYSISLYMLIQNIEVWWFFSD